MLSVGLVVDDAIVVVENVERHVREGRSRIEAALVGARELVGPIIAMTITLATVYTPIGVPGRADRLALPRVRDHPGRGGGGLRRRGGDALAGDELAVRPRARRGGPAHPAGEPRRSTRCAGRYGRLLDGALQMRWGIVAAALLVMVAAWPLYSFSRRELAPVEDQSHISLFMQASPDASLDGRRTAPRCEVVNRSRRSPRPSSCGR